MNQPSLLDEVLLLRKYQEQKSWTNAQLATSMTTYGWTWLEALIAEYFLGTQKPDEEHRTYIRRYLLNRYFVEALA